MAVLPLAIPSIADRVIITPGSLMKTDGGLATLN